MGLFLFFSSQAFFSLLMRFGGFLFLSRCFGGRIKRRRRLFRFMITFMYNYFIFICLASLIFLCVYCPPL